MADEAISNKPMRWMELALVTSQQGGCLQYFTDSQAAYLVASGFAPASFCVGRQAHSGTGIRRLS